MKESLPCFVTRFFFLAVITNIQQKGKKKTHYYQPIADSWAIQPTLPEQLKYPDSTLLIQDSTILELDSTQLN